MKKFEYKNLFMGDLDELNMLGVEGWEMCGTMGSNIILKRERTETFFQEVLNDEEKTPSLKFYDWNNENYKDLLEKVGDSTYVYIFLCGEFKGTYEYIEEVHVYNIDSVKDVKEVRDGLEKYSQDVVAWKFDYKNRILEEVEEAWKSSPFFNMLTKDVIVNDFLNVGWGYTKLRELVNDIGENNRGFIRCEVDMEDGCMYVVGVEVLEDSEDSRKNLKKSLSEHDYYRGYYFDIEKGICVKVI